MGICNKENFALKGKQIFDIFFSFYATKTFIFFISRRSMQKVRAGKITKKKIKNLDRNKTKLRFCALKQNLKNEKNLFFFVLYLVVFHLKFYFFHSFLIYSDDLFSDQLYMDIGLSSRLFNIMANTTIFASVISYKNLKSFLPKTYYTRGR